MTPANLFTEVRGTGKPLLCLHGWGMHSGIFGSLSAELTGELQWHLMDLPGHGNSLPIADFDQLDVLAAHVKTYIEQFAPEKINILAWSMGGLVGQWLAIHTPEIINKLVLVAGTACFENKSDWQNGIQPEVLQQFAAGLQQDYTATLDRFLALQFIGADAQKAQLRQARELIGGRPNPDINILAQGLQLLANTDLRDQVSQINCPILILSGERDKLVPTMATRMFAEKAKHANAVIFKGCGHAPFLSHQSLFLHYLQRFLHD